MFTEVLKIFLVGFLSSSTLAWSAGPLSPVPQVLPIVSESIFQPGNYWIWDYFEPSDKNTPHSTERYLVIERKKNDVTIEIRTQYRGSSQETPSARFTVRLDDCFQAFKNGVRRPFTIQMSSLQNGKWSKPFPIQSTAFEEKFNCNPLRYDKNHPHYVTRFLEETSKWGHLWFFQQESRKPDQILAYYFLDFGALSAVAYKKVFNESSPYEYEMDFVESGSSFNEPSCKKPGCAQVPP